MAVTGAEPISAGNLREVVSCVSREVLRADASAVSSSASFWFVGSLSDYDRFVIEWTDANNASGVGHADEVDATAGSHTLSGGKTVSLSQANDTKFAVQFTGGGMGAQWGVVTRIVGVRSGGGAAPS